MTTDWESLQNELPSSSVFAADDWNEWEEPPKGQLLPPAGEYVGALTNVNRVKTSGDAATFNLDFDIVGGTQDGKSIRFMPVSTKQYEVSSTGKRTSAMMNMLKAAGIAKPPSNSQELLATLRQMIDQRKLLGFEFDWRGFCTDCYKASLNTATRDGGEPTPDDYKVARKAGTRYKSYRAFPNEQGGGKSFTNTCSVCKASFEAQGNIRRFFVPKPASSNGGAPQAERKEKAASPADWS